MESLESLGMLQIHFLLITIAFAIDLIIGDPVYPLHPIRIIGTWISILRSTLFKLKLNGYFGGAILWFGTLIVPFSVCLLIKSYLNNQLILWLIKLFVLYSFFSAKDLITHVLNVYNGLINNGLDGGRKTVALIVGRCTDNLNESEISKAAVETLAENSSDGIIAPLFYAILFGPLGIIVYKCVNTLDSMVGYKSDKYIKFGYFSAKVDDLFNFIPARITALIILMHNIFNSLKFKKFWKYKQSHLSPNAGYPESAMASLLDVKMGGPANYHSQVVEKEYINPEGRDAIPEDIKVAIRIVWFRCLMILLFLIIVTTLTFLWNMK